MASVQELLLAAQAKQEESPLVGLARVLASSYESYQKAQDLAAERQVKQLQIEEAKQKADQRRQNSLRLKSLQEQIAATQSEKLKRKISIGGDGDVTETVEFGGADANGVPVNVIPAIKSGNLDALADFYKEEGVVPMDVLRQGTANRSISGVQNRFDDSLDFRRGESEKREQSGMSPENSGKLSMLNRAVKDIDEIRKLMINENGAVNRKSLASANLFPGGVPFTKGRDINSMIENAIAAKLRAETGAAATPDEIKGVARRFRFSLNDSDETIVNKINRLYDSLDETIQLVDPRGIKMNSLNRTGENPGINSSGKIKVTNGSETLMIDPNDETDALRDGFKRVK